MKGKFFKLLKSKLLWLNLLAVIVLAVIVFIGITYFLKSYTRHGEYYRVPNIIGMQIDDAQRALSAQGLNFVVSDSVYHDYFEPGAIVEQSPLPGSNVKEGRVVYLITNCFEEETVAMPDFVGLSVRQVQSLAETYGLVIGQLTYVPDIAVNVVIRQKNKGETVDPRTFIPKGSVIDLLVGQGLSDQKTFVPDLTGLNIREASDRLLRDYLNIGAVFYDTTVNNAVDSVQAMVYRQMPASDTINRVNLGYNIDVWLTTDEELIENDEDENDEMEDVDNE